MQQGTQQQRASSTPPDVQQQARVQQETENLNGKWRRYERIYERRRMIQRIYELLQKREPNAPVQQFEQLLQMSKQLEKSLFSTATSLEDYNDTMRLEERLEPLIERIGHEKPPLALQACQTMQRFQHKQAGSKPVSQNEAALLRKLRQLWTRKSKAEYIVDILIGSPYLGGWDGRSVYFHEETALVSLLEKEPSIAMDTSDPSEASLFHHLCNWCQGSESSNLFRWETVLRRVWQANPHAVHNDPTILSTLIGVFRHKSISEEWLDLIGTVGERWPKAYDDVVEDLPATKLNWRRLVRASGQDREEKSSIFDCYPHLIPHVSEFLVDLRGIGEKTTRSTDSTQAKNDDDNGMDSSGASWFVDDRIEARVPDWRRNSTDSPPARISPSGLEGYYPNDDERNLLNELRGQRIHEIIDCVVGEKQIGEISTQHHLLSIRCRRPQEYRASTVTKQRDGCSLSLNSMDMGEIILQISAASMLPIEDCFVRVTNTNDAERVTRSLPGCQVRELHLRSLPMSLRRISCDGLDGLVRMVAQHSTIQTFTISETEEGKFWDVGRSESAPQMELSCLAELVNLQSLHLHLVVAELAPYLAGLLRSSRQLERLYVVVYDSQGADLIMEAVGQSASLRDFVCVCDHGPLDLRLLLHHLETSNATLEKCWLKGIGAKGTPAQLETCFPLRKAIEYYCQLNRLGRRNLRVPTFSKADFVVDMLGLFGSRDRLLEHMFPQGSHQFAALHSRDRPDFEASYDLNVTSLLFGLLRENPAVWCTKSS